MEKINTELNNIINTYKPDAMSIEELFFNNNAKTAINVAQARGVILITARINKLDIFEYTPLQIKQAVTGYGRADKMQVQRMVKMILNTEKLPKLDDIISISELYDSKPPYLPKGAFSQAWSVAEIFRIILDTKVEEEAK